MEEQLTQQTQEIDQQSKEEPAEKYIYVGKNMSNTGLIKNTVYLKRPDKLIERAVVSKGELMKELFIPLREYAANTKKAENKARAVELRRDMNV